MALKPFPRLLTLCTGITLIVGLGACQTMSHENRLNQSSNQTNTSNIRYVKPNENFTIQLASNPTTGYSWQLAEPLDKNHIELINHTYQPNDHPQGMVGVGGTEIWQFRALKSGTTQIKMRYVHPWETEIPAAQEATYSIEIQ